MFRERTHLRAIARAWFCLNCLQCFSPLVNGARLFSPSHALLPTELGQSSSHRAEHVVCVPIGSSMCMCEFFPYGVLFVFRSSSLSERRHWADWLVRCFLFFMHLVYGPLLLSQYGCAEGICEVETRVTKQTSARLNGHLECFYWGEIMRKNNHKF